MKQETIVTNKVENEYPIQDDIWPSRRWNKERTEYTDLSGHPELDKLHNPKKIEGILLWNGGKPIEIGKADDQAFQEYPGSIELWQEFEGNRITRVQRWLKKSITHYVINNTFEPKN